MTYDKLMADIAELVRDWHFCNAHAPTALYLGKAQKAAAYWWKNGQELDGMALHFTEDADYIALG